MIDTNNSKIGNPFPFRIFCQKVIPLAFDESMSYLELLYSLLHYLKETVIPAVNNNADAVTELQNLYNELKSYVDNYFENLDVQEEINNKLDEMAESGQLAEIISLYLDYNLLQCYNTNAELKQSESLNAGSFAKTYGKLTYNDGYGNYYKIRTRTNADVPDDDNIIVLVNTENLVAEKIPNNYLEDVKDNLEGEIDDVENEIMDLKNDKYVMIGDSYGQGITAGGTTTGWCDRVKELLNLSNDDYFKFVEGGIGFVNTGNDGHTFLTLLEANISQITNRNKITKIVVCGGHNDRNYSSSQINNAINSFISYCKTNLPNAKIYIGMIGNSGQNNSTGAEIRQNIVNNVLRAYQNCVVFGGLYLNGIENIMHDYGNFMSSDNVHPTELGYQFISAYIYNALITGKADYISQINASTSKNITDSTTGTNFEIYTRLVNDVIEIKGSECDIKFSANKSVVDIINLGTITLHHFRATQKICIPVHFYFVCRSNNNTTYYGTTGLLKLDTTGNLYLQVDILPNNRKWIYKYTKHSRNTFQGFFIHSPYNSGLEIIKIKIRRILFKICAFLNEK